MLKLPVIIDVPAWFTPNEDRIGVKIRFTNWRMRQRLKPATEEETMYARLAEAGSPLQSMMEYRTVHYLRSCTVPTRLLVVSQSFGGDEIQARVADVIVTWESDGVPLLTLGTDPNTETIWGPLVLCIAPLNGEVPEKKWKESKKGRNPHFLEIIAHYGIWKPKML